MSYFCYFCLWAGIRIFRYQEHFLLWSGSFLNNHDFVVRALGEVYEHLNGIYGILLVLLVVGFRFFVILRNILLPFIIVSYVLGRFDLSGIWRRFVWGSSPPRIAILYSSSVYYPQLFLNYKYIILSRTWKIKFYQS